ncbi:MAG: hypothetical protein ACMVO3_15650 [Thalassobaculum sp.]
MRNRGTIGGSVANNDPAADYPAACLGPRRDHHDQQARDLGRRLLHRHVRDRAGGWRDDHRRFNFPMPEKAAYAKFPNPASRYALVGVFVAKTGGGARVAVTGAGQDGVFRVPDMESALGSTWSPDAVAGVFRRRWIPELGHPRERGIPGASHHRYGQARRRRRRLIADPVS